MIAFHQADITFRFPHAKICRQWLVSVARNEGKKIQEIHYIFTSDNYLHQINLDFLQHDTFTDVITFEYHEKGRAIKSDIYISLERVRENARLYSESVLNELHRVMVHGLLHLLGYHDKSDEEKKQMRARENYYLSLRPEKLKHWR